MAESSRLFQYYTSIYTESTDYQSPSAGLGWIEAKGSAISYHSGSDFVEDFVDVSKSTTIAQNHPISNHIGRLHLAKWPQ